MSLFCVWSLQTDILRVDDTCASIEILCVAITGHPANYSIHTRENWNYFSGLLSFRAQTVPQTYNVKVWWTRWRFEGTG